MKIKSLLFTSFIIMAMVLTGCSASTDPAPTATTAENNNTNTDSTNNNNNSKTGTIKLTCGNDAVYSGEDSVLEVSFENFESNPEKVDVYSEASTSPLLSGAAVNSGKITITAPANYAKNKIAYYVKSGSTESNHLSLNYYNSVSVSNFESFINSITSTDIVNIRLTGNYEDFKTKTKLLKNENLKINLDITQLSNVEIGEKAFCVCNSLVGIKLPDNITSIGVSAFSSCTKLESINLPDSITSIGKSAFFRCNSLITLNIPINITSIGDSAFASCKKLESIKLPDSITSIGKSAFSQCEELREIKLPENIIDIQDRTFSSCFKLKNISLPNGLQTIGKSAFSLSIAESIIIPSSVNKIGDGAFWSDGYLKNATFQNKTGWKVQYINSPYTNTEISENELANPEKAAVFLGSEYINHKWTRS